MVVPGRSAPSSLAVIQSKRTYMWRRCSPRYWKEILPSNECTGEEIDGGRLHWKRFRVGGLGYGRSKLGGSSRARCQGRLHGQKCHQGSCSHRASAVWGLGTSATLVSASAGGGSCPGSSPALSEAQIGGQTCTGMGMPVRKMGDLLAGSQGAWLALRDVRRRRSGPLLASAGWAWEGSSDRSSSGPAARPHGCHGVPFSLQ